MDIRGEILDYINRNETTGALLLTGRWGCGKSYLVRTLARELDESKGAAIAIISLFGLDSIAAINKRVKEEYFKFSHGVFGRLPKKKTEAITGMARDGMAVASTFANGNAILSAASHGLSSVINFDALDLIEVKNEIGKGSKTRRFVIVFDDLERSTLGKIVLFGAINEFVENRQIRVIIVADEEKIAAEEYKEYKEKLISRTIRLSVDYDELIDGIIGSYHETSQGYRAFLKENCLLLKQAFAESKTDNLRILKTAIADFERVYDAWRNSGIDTSNMGWALYSFAAEMFTARYPVEEKDDEDKKSVPVLFRRTSEQYSNLGRNLSIFMELRRWILEGVWDREAFISELTLKYSTPDMPSSVHFLLCNFWELQQRDIDEGLPEALQLAYQGELSRENLIHLLTKIHYLREYSVELPCIVHYGLIGSGLETRIEKIKHGRIEEPDCHTFAETKQLDTEAVAIYKRIKWLDDLIYAWKNRRLFIGYIQGQTIPLRGSFNGLCMQEFDDELIEVFKDGYANARNSRKRDLASSLMGIVFDSSTYSVEDNIQRTKKNLSNLIEWLNAQRTDDSITSLINRCFIQEIGNCSIMSGEGTE